MKTMLGYITPTILTFILPILALAASILLSNILWIIAFDSYTTERLLYKFENLEVSLFLIASVLALIATAYIGERFNQTNRLTINKAFILVVRIFTINITLIATMIAAYFYIIDTFKETISIWILGQITKNDLGLISTAYFVTLFFYSFLTPFFYTFINVDHKTIAVKRLFWLYIISLILFMGYLNDYANANNSASISWILMNINYIFVIGVTSFYISDHLNKENTKSLQESTVYLWIVIFSFIILYILYALTGNIRLEEYIKIMNLIFIPIGVGLFLNSILLIISYNINQAPFELGICNENQSKENPIISFFSKLIFILITFPAYFLHLVLIASFCINSSHSKKNHD